MTGLPQADPKPTALLNVLKLKAIWASNGADFGSLSPAQFGGFVSAEIKRWAAVVKASGAKLD